jgi:hypothetical protein
MLYMGFLSTDVSYVQSVECLSSSVGFFELPIFATFLTACKVIYNMYFYLSSLQDSV